MRQILETTIPGLFRFLAVVSVILIATTCVVYAFPGRVTRIPCLVLEFRPIPGLSLQTPHVAGFYTGWRTLRWPRRWQEGATLIVVVIPFLAFLGPCWSKSHRFRQKIKARLASRPSQAVSGAVSEFESRLNQKILSREELQAVDPRFERQVTPAKTVKSPEDLRREAEQLEFAEMALDTGGATQAIAILESVLEDHPARRDVLQYVLTLAYLQNRQADKARDCMYQLDALTLPLSRRYRLAVALDDARLYDLAMPVYQSILGERSSFKDVEERLAEIDQIMTGSGPEAFERELVRMVDSRYEAVMVFKSGASGIVFRGADSRSQEPVAIKMLSPFHRDDVVVRERFLKEAQILGKLSHPNIVKTIDVHSDPIPHYSMELITGSTLAERLRKSGRLPMHNLCHMVTQLTDGLAYCHSRDLFHRDIKPQNVLLASGDIVKIIDFGIVKESFASHLTEQGSLLGTPAYMAPEQFKGAAIDHRTDLYSLGVLSYEAATGFLPFAPGDGLESRILEGDYPPPSTHRKDLPGGFDAFIRKAMHTDPDLRFQSGAEFAEGIGSVVG